MPANLNALLRYKTINSCLFGGKRRWSIPELINACSDALAEARGRYELVSERTIRDDIRVLRSDILGFNAPIKQQNGLYFYSDPHYSMLNLRITDAGLADKIFNLLLSLRTEIKHPELEIILEQLSVLTKREYETKLSNKRTSETEKFDVIQSYLNFSFEQSEENKLIEESIFSPKNFNQSELNWDVIFKAINAS